MNDKAWLRAKGSQKQFGEEFDQYYFKNLKWVKAKLKNVQMYMRTVATGTSDNYNWDVKPIQRGFALKFAKYSQRAISGANDYNQIHMYKNYFYKPGMTIPMFFTKVKQSKLYTDTFSNLCANYGTPSNGMQGLGKYMNDLGAGTCWPVETNWSGLDHTMAVMFDTPIPEVFYTDGATSLKTIVSITGDLILEHKWTVSKRKATIDL